MQRCQAQKLKKLEANQAEVESAAAKAALPSVSSLQQQLQGEPSPQDAARTLLLLGKRVDLGDELGQKELAAAASILVTVAALLNDRSEAVAQATTYANNLHPMWKIESTAPPRIQLLSAPELRKASWALSKLKAKLGLEEPELLQVRFGKAGPANASWAPSKPA